MTYLTTTKLAARLNLDRDDLFAHLNELGWVSRENSKWILTAVGRQRGGQTRTTIDTGEFIVWPEEISGTLGSTITAPEEANSSSSFIENSEASEGENYISDYLDEIGVSYVSEHVITKSLDDKYASFRVADFYLSEYDVYLEFAGRWNRSENRSQALSKQETNVPGQQHTVHLDLSRQSWNTSLHFQPPVGDCANDSQTKKGFI